MEAQEQIAVVQYCELRKIPVYAIPNGGTRHKLEAINLKRQGVKAGVPDLCVPVAKKGYHGLYIEMKYGKNKATPKQEKWIKLLTSNGYFARVCVGAKEAIKLLDWYFDDRGQ